MWPPHRVNTCPTPACFSTRATSSPPVKSAIRSSAGGSAVADEDEGGPEERVGRLGLRAQRGLGAAQRLGLAEVLLARVGAEHRRGEIDGRAGGDRPVGGEQCPGARVEEGARESREALAAERA